MCLACLAITYLGSAVETAGLELNGYVSKLGCGRSGGDRQVGFQNFAAPAVAWAVRMGSAYGQSISRTGLWPGSSSPSTRGLWICQN
jgi:hypothetical protein